jgi:hypothetical protein
MSFMILAAGTLVVASMYTCNLTFLLPSNRQWERQVQHGQVPLITHVRPQRLDCTYQEQRTR